MELASRLAEAKSHITITCLKLGVVKTKYPSGISVVDEGPHTVAVRSVAGADVIGRPPRRHLNSC